MKLHIKIFSKNKISQILFLKNINQIFQNSRINLNYLAKNSQQTKVKRIFTVLKSPHVNKTAQEQFQYDIISRKLKFYTFQFLKLIIILQKLRSELFPDVLMKIYVIFKKNNLKKFKSYRLNPRLYRLKMIKRQSTSNLLSYLTFFDCYGSLGLKFV